MYQWYEEAAQEVERDLSLDISHLERVSLRHNHFDDPFWIPVFRILLFSSATFKTPTNKSFLFSKFFCLLLFAYFYHSSKI